MNLNNLKIAWRHLKKNRTFSLINLLGLALGLSVAMAVLLYVQDELSYESFHERADRIVRVDIEASYEGSEFKLPSAPNAVAPFLKQNLPGVEEAVRVFPHNFGDVASIRVGENNFTEKRLFWADPSIFRVFTIKLQSGSPDQVLERSNTAILSASTARRFFGAADPVGQTIRVDNTTDLEITGVFEDLPANTHLPLQVVGSFQTIHFGKPDRESWGNASFPTYLLLHSQVQAANMEHKISEVIRQKVPVDNQWFNLSLTPLLDTHLHSTDLTHIGQEVFGDPRQVSILIGLAILLLLIACINYMNLATAKSQQRSREVAVSKALGASGGRLAVQFYTETALLALVGVVFSVAILSLALPFFNQLSGKQLTLSLLMQPEFGLAVTAVWLIVTLLAGAYPAAYLSSFAPMSLFRQSFRAGSRAGRIRQGLVVFQFCVSTALIISTLVFYQQLNYIRNKKLGFKPEQVLAVRVTGAESMPQIFTLETEVGALPEVVSTGLSQTFPGSGASGRTLRRTGAAEESAGGQLATCRAYPGIFEVLDVSFLAGKPMRVRQDGDTIHQVVLNRSAVEYLGYATPEEAIGKRVEADLEMTEIAGVVEDFHFGSLHQKIGFYAFHNAPFEGFQFLLVRLRAEKFSDAMRRLQATFERVIPTAAFDYVFLDEHLESLYRTEHRMASVVFLFAGLAIFVACLGLFALVAFTAEQRTKEIGIRKVLGASVESLVALLSKDFLRLVAVSIAIAFPLGWYAMSRWLEGFAYRIDLQWWVFALAGILAILIAMMTVGYTGIRAALANPVEALRDE